MATEYFQSSLLAQEMEDTWTGTVRFNAEQGLTEAQKAQARENIGAVPFGSNLKILGHFNTVAELQASAPQNVGDAYSVGAATPYDLYIFEGLRNEWLNYGQIRAADISTRYVENQVIAVSAWTADTSTIAGFNYKAQITISGATRDDFPIVAFNQSDAISGNFAALAFSNNGHIEIFAKTKPTAAVTIPIATLIVNGGNGRGITNATGGIATGSIKTADLANGSVTAPKIADGAVTRAKLAQDALISPFKFFTGDTYSFVADDIGVTIMNSFVSGDSAEKTVNLTYEVSHAFPIGTILIVGRPESNPVKISFGENIRVGIPGNDSWISSPTVSISNRFSTVALTLKSSGAQDYWILTGEAEVVT